MAKKRKPAPKEEPSEESEDLSSEEEEEVEEEEEEEEEKGESSSEEEEEESEEDEDEEEVKDEGSKREAIRKLLKPFGKDQLIEILTDAAIKDPSVISKISQAAESDPDHRNIFVHGLGWDTTTETLLSVFKQYGQIEQGTVVTDKVTGMSKGYGFILFKTRAGARKALKDPHKKIGGRMTSCNLASFGPPPNQPTSSDRTGRKLYVANVGPHINPEKLRAFFAKFGEIEEGPLGYDRLTGKLKGYALFIYKTTEGCTKALEQPTKLFEGCQLQCKKAMEGPRANKNQTGKVTGPAIASPTAFPRNDFAPTYSMGLSPGMVSQNQNPAGALVGQNSGIGVMNPVLGTSLNQTGLSSSVASGFSPSVNPNGMTPPLGFNAGFGGHGVNSISPSVMGSYGSQAALQGLGVYHNAQLGQPAAAAAPTNVIGSYGSQAALQGLGAYHNAQLGQPAAAAAPTNVIGSYGSQAALQGLGAYHNAQLGQSAAAAAAARSQSGLGPIGTIPSYYGR